MENRCLVIPSKIKIPRAESMLTPPELSLQVYPDPEAKRLALMPEWKVLAGGV